MNVLLPVVIFVSWFALVIAPAGRLALEDTRAGIPKEQRRGVSLLPGFPAMPLLAWGTSIAVDLFASPWGLWISVGAHGVVLVVCVAIITRDMLRLWKLKNQPGEF